MSVVLLAEDDERLASLVKDYLEANGLTVAVEAFGLRVPRQVQSMQPDILILDLNLPGKDGISICREVRGAGFSGPILMLTARDTDADQVLGFDVGADDYVIKPAEPRVLLARIHALLRRSQQVPAEQEDIVMGCLSIRSQAREVTLDNTPVALSSHEFDLLLTLARQAGKVLSREYLFTTICNRAYDGLDRTVDVRVSHLRKKLGDNSENPARIKTVWGRGYMLVPDAW
ncbi:response regulator transcription factor [Gilvimarinus agarilyticus]|uniref:response regulator transcription factor n=1 Tax=unclassified Gilvimarinus TaxID=2642066 RepID=UPI001C08CB07|nr:MULTISPECIES: response regulator transcription factor [unclassified Gilvimarinus]MBU2885073.1 response regulator transcription factor [Gilvimarinus agarilyticus]MDO6569970.1 response regulator transcription factor [Gilvimarinus sp. 2_MG-2023]MDO6747236.1 response regulator transcription factor [Gilvimarinus sp. 1_MG-2023]